MNGSLAFNWGAVICVHTLSLWKNPSHQDIFRIAVIRAFLHEIKTSKHYQSSGMFCFIVTCYLEMIFIKANIEQELVATADKNLQRYEFG